MMQASGISHPLKVLYMHYKPVEPQEDKLGISYSKEISRTISIFITYIMTKNDQ